MLDNIKRSWQEDERLKLEIQQIIAGTESKFTWRNDLLLRKGKLVVGDDNGLRQNTIHTFHASSASRHSGVHVTSKRITGFCYWKGLKRDVRLYIRGCDSCQRCKYDQSSYPGLLQPLLIPTAVWTEISMDFIEGRSALVKRKRGYHGGRGPLDKVCSFPSLKAPLLSCNGG